MTLLYILTAAFFILFFRKISNTAPMIHWVFRLLVTGVATVIFFYIAEAIYEIITVKIMDD